MICKNCGKELPEGAKFCGVCGTPVEEIKLEEPVEEPVQPVEETPTQEETSTPSTEESVQPIEPVEEEPIVEQPTTEPEKVEQPSEEAETTPIETVEEQHEQEQPVVEENNDLTEEIKDSIKNTSSAKVLLGEDGKLDKNDFARVGNQAKDAAKKAYQSIEWNEFKTFLDILKDPFGTHSLALLPSCVVAIFALITNSWFFGSFAMGIITTAILYIAYSMLIYINKGEEKYNFKTIFGKASQYYTLPILLLFIVCILSLFSGAMTAQLLHGSSHSLPMISIIEGILIVFTFITFIVSLMKVSKNMNAYLLILFITVVLCLILYLWFSFVLIQLANVLSWM